MSIKMKLKKIWQIIWGKEGSGNNINAPYIFSNQPSDDDTEDLIGMDAYVYSLKAAIESGNRMIGVLSEFGVGKSTLIKRLQRSYKDNCERVKIININLWSNLPEEKADATQLHKSYLYQFATQINKNLGIYVNRRINKGYGLIKISAVNPFTIWLLFASVSIFTLSKLVDEGVLTWFSKYPTSINYGIIFSVILFVLAIYFSEILFASPKFQAGREANEQDFAELYAMIAKKATRYGKKTVIAFDDIDRAKSPKTVLDFLTELHKIYLIGTHEYKNISYIINIKPEKPFNDVMLSSVPCSPNAINHDNEMDGNKKAGQEQNQGDANSFFIYTKIFDYMISLQPVNKLDLRYLLEKYIQKNMSFYIANEVPMIDGNDDVDRIKGMSWLCFGEHLDIRGMKKRLNYANQMFYSLKVRFPGTNNISFEKCAIVAYLEDRYPDDFYKLQHDTIGEIIGKYFSLTEIEKTWQNAVNSIIKSKDAGFASDLASFLQREQIDSGYRQYFYNYPKICVIRSYEEDKVYNTIIHNKPLDKQFNSILQIAIKKNAVIVLEAYKSIRLRGSDLPTTVFENEILLQFAMNNEDNMVVEYLQGHINIVQIEALSTFMKRIFGMQICDEFHKKYSEIIGNILYKQLSDMAESKVIEYRKSFLLSVGIFVKHYRRLFVTDLPSISLGELDIVADPDIAIELANSDKVDKLIISSLFEMVLKKPAYSPVYKKFEKLVKDTLGEENRGFNDTFYAPILCKYMKTTGKINEDFEKVITNAIRTDNFTLTEYISLINSIPADKLHNNTYKNIKDIPIHESLSESICYQLLKRGLGVEYFANMRERLDSINFIGKNKDLFVLSSKRIFDLYPILFNECRRRLCAAIPQSITNYNALFRKPYPIISSQELQLIDLTNGIKLIDKSRLSDKEAKDIASAFCVDKRNVSETTEILNFVCSLKPYTLRSTTFNALNFEQLSYTALGNDKKSQITTSLSKSLELINPEKAIEYMSKTHFLDETLERVVLNKGNDKDYLNYGKLLFGFSSGTATTRKILVNDKNVMERPDFALQILFDQKEYAKYVASLRKSKDMFVFEQEKIKELGETYWQIYSGKLGFGVTRKTMIDNKDIIEYVYGLDREFVTEEEYLIPFSSYPQTDKLLDALCSCPTVIVQKYVIASKNNLKFLSEDIRQRFVNHGLSNEEWLLDRDIKKTLYNVCLDESEKKSIIAQFKKINRARKNKDIM